MTAKSNTRSTKHSRQRPEPVRLDRRYHKIGISAVAAAIRYGSDGKNPAYAPVVVAKGDPPADA